MRLFKTMIAMSLILAMMSINVSGMVTGDEALAGTIADALLATTKTNDLKTLLNLMDDISDVEAFMVVFNDAFGILTSGDDAENISATAMLYYEVVGADQLGDKEAIVSQLLAIAPGDKSLSAELGLSQGEIAASVAGLDQVFRMMSNSVIASALGDNKMLFSADETHNALTVDQTRAEALVTDASQFIQLNITDMDDLHSSLGQLTDYYSGLSASEKAAVYGYLDTYGLVEETSAAVVPVVTPVVTGGGGGAKIRTILIDDEAIVRAVPNFMDLTTVPWAVDSINGLYQFGVINGKSLDNFDPDGDLTRAEFAALIVRLLELTPTGDSRFNDVADTEWFFAEVNTCADHGYVNGVGDEMFAPLASVTREEVATILGRIMMDKGILALDEGTTAGLIDGLDDAAMIDDWARTGSALLYNNALQISNESAVDGTVNSFFPDRPASRAEVAVMLFQLSDVVPTKVVVLKEEVAAE